MPQGKPFNSLSFRENLDVFKLDISVMVSVCCFSIFVVAVGVGLCWWY